MLSDGTVGASLGRHKQECLWEIMVVFEAAHFRTRAQGGLNGISMRSKKRVRVGKKLLSQIFVNNMPYNKTKSSGTQVSGCDRHGCALDDQVGRMDSLDVENG